ncbi:hypothetical protein L6452_23143 [Arctium lappa]|uniref:Uncharacterized protein n=1 Tax=Arctium lappa TaxID=4217 RepID=A0ACB9B0P2_ARCLA|nr:hypothetical protein L6452_23143 [Arctium lappa]
MNLYSYNNLQNTNSHFNTTSHLTTISSCCTLDFFVLFFNCRCSGFLLISIHLATLGEVDPTFIQNLKLAATEARGIPPIDLSPLLNSSPATTVQDLVNQVRDACKDWGFFLVFNHGVPLESRERLMSAAKRFFDQPMEEKRKVCSFLFELVLAFFLISMMFFLIEIAWIKVALLEIRRRWINCDSVMYQNGRGVFMEGGSGVHRERRVRRG